MSGGAVIENLSNRKLSYILIFLLFAQIAFFLVGAWYCPVPTSSMDFIMTKCKDDHKGNKPKWFYIRPKDGRCIEEEREDQYNRNEIVYTAQMPHVRQGVQLSYSPWFQFLLGLIHIEVIYHNQFNYTEHAKLLLNVDMAYRTKEDGPTDWKPLWSANVTRTLECTIADHKKSQGNSYECDIMDLFEMGSNNYPFYLINIRIPTDDAACNKDQNAPNCQIGIFNTLRIIEIHQNGGFTLVWLWLKTIVSPFIIGAVIWFWNRVSLLHRQPMLLEKSILAMGVSLAVLDFPIEWISIFIRIPFALLLSDLRQGLFYFVLLSFWLIFAGEHLIDDTTRNNILSYRFNLLFIGVASAALLIYDMAERGSQLIDPFYSIWSTETGSTVAYISIYTASICTLIYFVFLFWKIFKVWTSIKRKRAAQLYKTCVNRRLKVEMIIYRFKFLMLFTLVCAGLTIASYIMKQYGEAQIHSATDPDEVQHSYSTSAFFTGAFGMWNIYVLLILGMYAPSHKQYSGSSELVDESEELMDGGTESNVMTTFLKPATD